MAASHHHPVSITTPRCVTIHRHHKRECVVCVQVTIILIQARSLLLPSLIQTPSCYCSLLLPPSLILTRSCNCPHSFRPELLLLSLILTRSCYCSLICYCPHSS